LPKSLLSRPGPSPPNVTSVRKQTEGAGAFSVRSTNGGSRDLQVPEHRSRNHPAFRPGDISLYSPHRRRTPPASRAVGAADVSPALQRWESAPIHFREIKYAAKTRSNPALRPTGYSPIDPDKRPRVAEMSRQSYPRHFGPLAPWATAATAAGGATEQGHEAPRVAPSAQAARKHP
jgi:hypothetical protein